MSLINKMLQDLESRQNAQAEAANTKSVYEDLKPVKVAGLRTPSRRLMAMLSVIAIVGAGAYAWMQWGDHLFFAEETTPVKPRPVTVRKAPPKPAPAAETIAAAPAAAKETPAPPATRPVPVTEQKSTETAAPTTTAAKEKTAKRETPAAPATPEKTTALAKGKSPTTTPAGYWTVARGETLYSISAKSGVGLGDLSRWNQLGSEHTIRPGQRLRLTPPASSEAQAEAGQTEEKKPEKKKEEASVASATRPRAEERASKETIPTAAAAEEQRTDAGAVDKKLKPPSPPEQAEDEYRQAVNLLQQGRAGDAEKHLRSALDASAEHTNARELLAGLALQNGRWREAVQLLEQGVAKVPSYYPFAQLLARVYVDHGSDQKALAVMEGSRQAGAGSADFTAFLAALYQRAGKHAEAVKAYTEAIKLNPQEGRWWLGMGISLEAAQDWNAAGSAYQRAIDSGALDNNLLHYAQQRLAVVKNK